MGEIKKIDIRIVCIYGVRILFLLCIAFVTYEAYIYRAGGIVKVIPLLFVMAITFICLCVVKYFVEKYTIFFTKYSILIIFFYLLFTFVIQIIIGNQIRYIPMWDLNSVYSGAISWVEQGNIGEYADYFYYFPNNLGLLFLFKGYFTVVYAVFGTETDYFMAALVLGSVTVTLFRFSVIWTSKKLFGNKYAIIAMVLLSLCFPLYFSAAVFYTDIMSFAAPTLFYLVYLYAKESVSFKKKVLLYILMALIADFGMEIKFTVAIIVIAVGIEILLTDSWKQCLLMAGINIIVIMAIFTLTDHIVYSEILEREQAKIQNTPYLHWIMMGAQGDGSYNPMDYEFTRSFGDTKERQKALKAEVIRRYKELKGVL